MRGVGPEVGLEGPGLEAPSEGQPGEKGDSAFLPDSCEWMTCYDKKLRRTGPEQLSSRSDLLPVPPLHSRVNGWSLPLHSFQLITLLLYLYMAVVAFGIYIPLLPHGWTFAAYGVIGTLFVYHFVSHLVAVSIDPADCNVLVKKNYSNPMPAFDRSKCQHVIRNQHCYLCEVDVGPKAKHCSACNKCIADFDHHCSWLNNCVGSRNYWWFFNAVASAVLGALLMILVLLYIFVQYFVDPEQLRTAPQFESAGGNGTWLVFLPLVPVETAAAGILVVAALTLLMALASFLLLGHLLMFHLYLLAKRLSTYEYMTRHRIKDSVASEETSVGAASETSCKMEPIQSDCRE